jgi:hypothetical protein
MRRLEREHQRVLRILATGDPNATLEPGAAGGQTAPQIALGGGTRPVPEQPSHLLARPELTEEPARRLMPGAGA